MHTPPAEGNFCDEHGNSLKPTTMEYYNWHTGYNDKSNKMANNCSMSCHIWKWTNKLFFHLVDLTILNSWILASCGAKCAHRDFRLFVRKLLKESGRELCPELAMIGRPTPAPTSAAWLQSNHNKHWSQGTVEVLCVLSSWTHYVDRVLLCKAQSWITFVSMYWGLPYKIVLIKLTCPRWHANADTFC
jgi:hypothetical protein